MTILIHMYAIFGNQLLRMLLALNIEHITETSNWLLLFSSPVQLPVRYWPYALLFAHYSHRSEHWPIVYFSSEQFHFGWAYYWSGGAAGCLILSFICGLFASACVLVHKKQQRKMETVVL
uniref:GPI mannosyltransferase 2 n=1 Tax=Heterorhabditis bacteriophora TaxID=37862 RepID=A0A1I7XHX7_HETBA